MTYYDRMAGTMTYHPTHGHNHSDDWGVFTLRTMDQNDPNPLNWPIVSDGAKMGFCLMDYGTCGTGTTSTYYGHCRDENRYSPDYLEYFPEYDDGSNGGNVKYNNDFPNFGLGGGNYGCSPIEQGISSGWLDLYGEWLDDQWINIEPGLCNGVYWIVGVVDLNDNYLESNEDNNWTAIPVTLTQQLDGGGYDISIISPDEVSLCSGEVTTLTASSFSADEYLWSTGETTPTIDVSESGNYSLTTSSECGEGQSQVISVIVNDPIEEPIANDLTITSGESAVLNATGSGNIIWQNASGEMLSEGTEFISDPLFENTSFYAVNEEILVEAPESLFTGAAIHEGSSDYSGTVYNGGLRFDCLTPFTLNSVTVYTDYEGERTIELLNNAGEVINEFVVNIPEVGDNGYVVNLNWEITTGNNYILTTNTDVNNQNFGDNNPLLKRTADDLPNFPYNIDGIVEINEGYYNSGDNPGFSTSYYYYFYNWEINNQWSIGEEVCLSQPTEIQIFVEDPDDTMTQQISIPQGWFIFSTYINPDDSNISSIVSSNVDNIVIVKNYLGDVYWPSVGINTIGDITQGQGYYIKSNENHLLEIEGMQIDYDYPINLPSGWSIIGYLHTDPKSSIDMMAPIIDNMVIMKDYIGNVYWPGVGVNSIEDLNPGQGYNIRVTSSATFSYPEMNSGRFMFDENTFVSANYNTPKITGNNMTIGLPSEIWQKKPVLGDEIIIYDQNDMIVGIGPYRPEFSAITIWGDDDLTNDKDGLYNGEEFTLKLWRHNQNIEEAIIIIDWKEGSGTYQTNGISIASEIIHETIVEKQLIYITDILGRKVDSKSKNVLLYIYDDGSIEKEYLIE